MPLIAKCPSCQASNRIPDALGAKKIRCHKCKSVFAPTSAKPEKKSKTPAPAANRANVVLGLALMAFALLGMCGVGGFAAFLYWPRPEPAPIALNPLPRTPIEEKKTPIVEEKKIPVIEEKKEPVVEKKPPLEKKKPDPVIVPKKKNRELTRITHKPEPGKRYPRDIDMTSTVLDDVTLRKIVPSVYLHTPYWYPDGKSLCTIQYHNCLMQLDADGFAIHRDRVYYEDEKPVFFRGGISQAYDGLLALRSLDHAAKGEDIQLLVVDPLTLMPIKKIPCPNASLVASSHLISVAFVGGKNTYDGKQADLMIVDLKTGATAKPDAGYPLNPQAFQVSRDGKFFYGTDGKSIARFRIDGANLVHEETSAVVFNKEGTEPRLGLSPDGERIWLYGVDPAKQNVPNNTQFRILKAQQLKVGFQGLGFPVSALAFDPRDKLLVGSDWTQPGMWFLSKGFPERYGFSIPQATQILMNPQGGSALLQCGPDLYHAEWLK